MCKYKFLDIQAIVKQVGSRALFFRAGRYYRYSELFFVLVHQYVNLSKFYYNQSSNIERNIAFPKARLPIDY